MKKHILLIFLGLFLMTSCQLYFPPPVEAPPPAEPYPVQQVPEPAIGLDVSYFYESLSPYGIWVYHPVHRYVWVPSSMSLGWRPYTRGQWAWTDYGWTWSSHFAWGWGPFQTSAGTGYLEPYGVLAGLPGVTATSTLDGHLSRQESVLSRGSESETSTLEFLEDTGFLWMGLISCILLSTGMCSRMSGT
jgi:hypothetical protein